MNKFILALSIFSFFSPMYSEAALSTTTEIDEYLTSVVNLFKENKNEEGSQILMAHWPKTDAAEIKSMAKGIVDAGKYNESKLGKILGSEKVGTCRVGKFLYKTQWVLKFERGFVFWNFSFYNSGKNWILESYRFNSEGFVPLSHDCR